MFRYPEDIKYTTMTAGSKIDPSWYGMKFAAAPRYPNAEAPWLEGALLVTQYVESYIYRTHGLYRADDSFIQPLYSAACAKDGTAQDDYPTLEALMTACQDSFNVNGGTRRCVINGYNNGGSALNLEVGYVRNVQNDLKYFLRQYGQLILETKITDTTHNQSAYEISGSGNDLGFEEYSKGFIMYGYDASYIYIQNTRGVFAGSLGFHKMPWTLVPQLVRRGACWRLKNPS